MDLTALEHCRQASATKSATEIGRELSKCPTNGFSKDFKIHCLPLSSSMALSINAPDIVDDNGQMPLMPGRSWEQICRN